MHTYFQTLYQSITDPKSINRLILQPFRQVFGYFFFFSLLTSLITTIHLLLTVVPTKLELVHQALGTLESNYPEGLNLSFENNQLTPSGTETPFHLPLHKGENSSEAREWGSPPPTSKTPATSTTLLTIDPSLSAESIQDLPTLILLTKSALAFKLTPESQEYQFIRYQDIVGPLQEAGDIPTPFVVTHENVVATSQQIRSNLGTIRLVIPLLIFLGNFFGNLLTNLIFLGLYTIFTSSLGSLLSRPLGYSTYFKLGLFVLVPLNLLFSIYPILYAQDYLNYFAPAFLTLTTLYTLGLNKTKPA